MKKMCFTPFVTETSYNFLIKILLTPDYKRAKENNCKSF